MAKAGAGKASALSLDGISMPMALNAIALCFASDVSARREVPDAKGCHHDRKRGGNCCHSGGGLSSRSDAASTYVFFPSGIVSLRVLRDLGLFSNCAEACAVGPAPVIRGEPRYGPHLGRDGDSVG